MNKPMQKSDMHFVEFIALMALLMSLMALSIDIMLPAMTQIGHDLQVAHTNDNQLIISLLFLGFAIGMIFYGPLSDSFGRKPAIYLGLSIAIIGCIISLVAESYSTMLLGRFLQGLGLASARIITVALVRDLYHGNEMGKVMSLIMSLFILVPILAPALGQGILFIAHWRMIFVFILAVSVLVLIWFAIRQVETIHHEDKIPFSLKSIGKNLWLILKNKEVMAYTVMSGFVFGAFLGYLNSSQQIFQEQYHLGVMFPFYFGVLAISVGFASLLNAKLVMKYGMYDMSKYALFIITLTSTVFFWFSSQSNGNPALWQLMIYLAIVLFCFGILMGNLNGLAMEPLGHMAGIGASLVGAVSTFIAVPFGAIIGQSYTQSVLPLVLGFSPLVYYLYW
ncbi:MAG: multidrug effflux MFS transporter [Ghiorsea sp.]|nr:multidrug effflux MFS transporter [Ghiorsea sp.]